MTLALVPAIDGPQYTGNPDVGCCPPSLCNIDYCSFICSFIAYLPKGPLWDYWKEMRSNQMRSSNPDDCNFTICEDNACLTIIDHAIYVAKKLLFVLQNPLQTVIWESNPLTAFITRQYYLDQAGWSDCFDGPNANVRLGYPTPYQAVCNALLPPELCSIDTTLYQMSPSIHGEQNPIIDIAEQVKAACPQALMLATEYGILVALQRLKLGVIKNLDGINFVLEPLGAQITVSVFDPLTGECSVDCNQMSGTPVAECFMVNDCNQMPGTEPCVIYRPCMTINLSNNGLKIKAGPGISEPLLCDTARLDKELIKAWYYFPGILMPVTTECPDPTIAGNGFIWPALMAAECILLSILPTNLNYTLNRISTPNPS